MLPSVETCRSVVAVASKRYQTDVPTFSALTSSGETVAAVASTVDSRGSESMRIASAKASLGGGSAAKATLCAERREVTKNDATTR